MNSGKRKQGNAGKKTDSSPYINMYFECCKTYSRIYLNNDGDAFVGWCPRCAGKAVVRVDPDAEPGKFFRAK